MSALKIWCNGCGSPLRVQGGTAFCDECHTYFKPGEAMSALNAQVGGSHYRGGSIQPVQYIEANQLAFLEGCVVKRVTRHNREGGKGRQDIEKAIHELQLLLELRYSKQKGVDVTIAIDPARDYAAGGVFGGFPGVSKPGAGDCKPPGAE